jgi:hypothetical protein
MTNVLRGRARLAALTLLVCLAAAVFAASAATDISIGGTASGKTMPLGNGTFRIVGKYVDPASVTGTYVGTYREVTTGYTACGVFQVATTCSRPFCNLVSGQVTLSSQGKSVVLPIVSVFQVFSAVCLDPVDPSVHDVHLFGCSCGADVISRGYGLPVAAFGGLDGISRPFESVYTDSFALSFGLDY